MKAPQLERAGLEVGGNLMRYVVGLVRALLQRLGAALFVASHPPVQALRGPVEQRQGSNLRPKDYESNLERCPRLRGVALNCIFAVQQGRKTGRSGLRATTCNDLQANCWDAIVPEKSSRSGGGGAHREPTRVDQRHDQIARQLQGPGWSGFKQWSGPTQVPSPWEPCAFLRTTSWAACRSGGGSNLSGAVAGGCSGGGPMLLAKLTSRWSHVAGGRHPGRFTAFWEFTLPSRGIDLRSMASSEPDD